MKRQGILTKLNEFVGYSEGAAWQKEDITALKGLNVSARKNLLREAVS